MTERVGVVEGEKIYRCSRCGQDKPESAFYANRIKQKSYWCKACCNAYNKQNFIDNQNKRVKAAMAGYPAPAAALPAALPAPPPRCVVTIDFSAHQELLEDMQRWAEEQFRTLDQQLLYFLYDVRRRTPEMQRI